METYTAKELSKIAGVSVRTLHYYDKIGLLKPAIRTEAKYRLYGEQQLLKLQQILFYKELGFPLKEIIEILDAPDFDVLNALKNHKVALISKQERISVMLNTIDKTMLNLKGKKMITNDELYEGFTVTEKEKIREEAIEKFGKDEVLTSEHHLKKLSKAQFEVLKNEQKDIFKHLFSLRNQEPESKEVQLEVAKHFENTMQFWGIDKPYKNQRKKYKGLGKLYLNDERFTKVDGVSQPEFAEFLSKAISYFASTQLI